MLYIWPFFAFFSLPLLLPYAFWFINLILYFLPTGFSKPAARTPPETESSLRPLSMSFGKSSSRKSSKEVSGSEKDEVVDTPSSKSPEASKELQIFQLMFGSKIFLWPIYLLGTIIISIAIVRYNTIIHPFTLADNRHYMFYVFRYTIRRASWIRYTLVVPYTLARWMTWGTMAGCCSQWFSVLHEPACSTYAKYDGDRPFLSHPASTFGGTTRKTTQQQDIDQALEKDPLMASIEPATISTGLIFLLATTLSLMTAPLVEPRYFIIPWVMWRLFVPAWRFHDHSGPRGFSSILGNHPKTKPLILFFQRYDLRLILETFWFIAINAVTGYIFLTKPYVWKAEDGTVLDGGRLQRFMW